MLGYVTLGTRDLDRAAGFYDAIAAEMGTKRMMSWDRSGQPWGVAWGEPGGAAGLGVCLPFDGQQATVGNGVMAALAGTDPAHVDRVYARALELGGADEGPPGDRGGGFYAAYFRDLDGNKLNVFCMTG